MRYCIVKECKNNSKTPNVNFYRFPTCERRKIWIEFVGREETWAPMPTTTICSAHFSPHLIDGAKRLRKGANPISNLDIATIAAGNA
jgi:hypothetical protein